MAPMNHSPESTTQFAGVTIKTQESDISKRAICLKLAFGTFGNSKKISTSQIDLKNLDGTKDEKVKKQRIRASKSLLESPELEAIKSFHRSVVKYVDSLTMPFDIGVKSVKMVACVLVPDLDKKLDEFSNKHEELVQKFIEAYPMRCQQASTDLGSAYSPTDYVPAAELEKEFGFWWQWISFGVPEQLQQISPEVWETERKKAAESMAEAAAEMQVVLRESMAQLVEHLAERLNNVDEKTGKLVRFQETAVSNLMEFLNNFEFKNLTGDADLADQVAKAKQLLAGVSTDTLKNRATMRARIQKGMTEIAGTLDTLVVSGGRKFRFEEEA